MARRELQLVMWALDEWERRVFRDAVERNSPLLDRPATPPSAAAAE